MHLFVSSLLFFCLFVFPLDSSFLLPVPWDCRSLRASGQGERVVYNDSQKNVPLGSRKDASD